VREEGRGKREEGRGKGERSEKGEESTRRTCGQATYRARYTECAVCLSLSCIHHAAHLRSSSSRLSISSPKVTRIDFDAWNTCRHTRHSSNSPTHSCQVYGCSSSDCRLPPAAPAPPPTAPTRLVLFLLPDPRHAGCRQQLLFHVLLLLRLLLRLLLLLQLCSFCSSSSSPTHRLPAAAGESASRVEDVAWLACPTNKCHHDHEHEHEHEHDSTSYLRSYAPTHR